MKDDIISEIVERLNTYSESRLTYVLNLLNGLFHKDS